MNKQQLIRIITSSVSSESLRQRLLRLVETSAKLDEAVIQRIRLEIQKEIDEAAENVTNLQLQYAAHLFEKKLDGIEKDADALGKELRQKADEIDLAVARAKLG